MWCRRFPSFLCSVVVFSRHLFCLVLLPVRPKFQTYGVRHMLPYLYLCLSSTLVSYELLVYPVILPTLMYPMLRLLDYKI